jgi:hypothetical protein
MRCDPVALPPAIELHAFSGRGANGFYLHGPVRLRPSGYSLAHRDRRLRLHIRAFSLPFPSFLIDLTASLVLVLSLSENGFAVFKSTNEKLHFPVICPSSI